MLKWNTIFLILTVSVFASAGKITSITGPTQITRLENRIAGKIESSIEMLDTIETLQSRTGITFADNTRVSVTEHSKLLIDSFVYDSSTGKGKLGLKATLGTIRYASGKIGHNSRESVNIQTPTASVAVRGTDFSMTVDEIGRSLVILLPGVDKVVGIIDVSTMAGSVTLDKAFQGTFVVSAQTPPTPPVIFNLDEGGISNNLLLDSPKPITGQSPSLAKADSQNKPQNGFDPNSAEIKIIEIIDQSKFAFVDNGPVSELRNKISGNIIAIRVPQTTGATLTYAYVGGRAEAKNGTGVGVEINITQK